MAPFGGFGASKLSKPKQNAQAAMMYGGKPQQMPTGGPSNSYVKKPCNNFMLSGSCPFGDKCKFSHDQTQGVEQIAAAMLSGNSDQQKQIQEMIQAATGM